MDKTDIRNLRRWHRKVAFRARDAGFDIVCVYATHAYLLGNVLDRKTNARSDEYDGSLENRIRLLRELTEEANEATFEVYIGFVQEETSKPVVTVGRFYLT